MGRRERREVQSKALKIGLSTGDGRSRSGASARTIVEFRTLQSAPVALPGGRRRVEQRGRLHSVGGTSWPSQMDRPRLLPPPSLLRTPDVQSGERQ